MFDVVVAPPSSEAATTDSTDQAKSVNEKKQSVDNNDATDNTSIRTPQLAFLPTKFRKLVWIKRNDFVIVECGDEEDNETNDQNQSDKKEGGGFRYVISHILYKDQVKHIKSKGLWPTDSFFDDEASSEDKAQKTRPQDENLKKDEDNQSEDNDEYYANGNDDGIVFDDPLADEFMVNTNRIAAMRVEDSSSDESDD